MGRFVGPRGLNLHGEKLRGGPTLPMKEKTDQEEKKRRISHPPVKRGLVPEGRRQEKDFSKIGNEGTVRS